ncbi:protein phosphatase 1 regulatory subunit 12A [Elysia marginata]|uniref:Protein phosphatase 1 regulatory subunit 12B n=1 Tax=Elysia marginata TaxID=1093978 RepID=A0AAV4HUA3_9GAST|nr:protein phosphatase 1 regulatory subunit 12A [Elysia marginata]
MMAADEKQVSALIRRSEQVKRWEGSDTFLEPCTPKKDNIKVKFQDGCVFLAACSSGDKEEVKKLLQKEADINTANVDGLTALHQACIDDNLEMVEFLVENGADVDVCDNEGWTPLHATASCAFTEIARYLLKHGASVAAVNNDGDLPMDIAENDEMEKLLKEEMDRQGIDADAARCEEEQRMLEDANQWMSEQTVEEVRHPKTGATALHVAAAKGYMKVMSLLLEAGVDVNAEDLDGWTPLHAAAHWGQEDACKLLAEHNCDMLYKNKAGHTALDLAEKDMLKLLEELKENQAAVRMKQEIDTDAHILTSGTSGKRRSSVTRMSVDQKQNVIQRTSGEERETLASLHPEDKLPTIHSLAKAQEERELEDAETGRKSIQRLTCTVP